MSQGLIDASFVTVTEKNPKVPLFFFSLPSLSFLHSLSFNIHYKCVTGSRRVEKGEQYVLTLSTTLQLMPGSSSFSQQAVGGPATAPLSASHLQPSATTRINRSATPYKRSTEVHASQHSAPPTMTSHVAQDRDRGSENKMELLQVNIKIKWSRKIKAEIHLFYFEKILCDFLRHFSDFKLYYYEDYLYNSDQRPLFRQILWQLCLSYTSTKLFN